MHTVRAHRDHLEQRPVANLPESQIEERLEMKEPVR